ncbi:MAG: hypothetical protein KC731_26530 [Myxococcales bacterium]|nr:hypothetical protein [Myxococcales bacterium]
MEPRARFALVPPNVVRTTILGMLDPVTGAPFDLDGTITILEDGVERDLHVEPAGQAKTPVEVDIVFAISSDAPRMNDEAEAVAATIVDFGRLLRDGGIDARMAAFGHGSIWGGCELGDVVALSDYLEREGRRGTGRVRSALEGSRLTDFDMKDEPGRPNVLTTIVFTERELDWRPAAHRVFVNVTDSGNDLDGADPATFATAQACAHWPPERGVVHTIYSGEPIDQVEFEPGKVDDPGALSQCTGGVVMSVSPSAQELKLADMPMTSALLASVVVEYKTADFSKPHDITVILRRNGEERRSEYPAVSYR